MTEAEVLELLERVGAFRSGHFVFTHGAHSDTYVLKDAMYAYPRETSTVCRGMADRFKDDNIEAVIGPAIGAAILSQWVAYHLGEMTGNDVAAVYADKDGQGGFVIKRGYDKVIKGKRTLVVEDLTTTGGSVKKAVDVAREAGADVAGVVVLCNRGDVTAEMVGNPPKFVSMVHVHLESWDAAGCELCAKGIPVNVDVGHGKAFLAQKGE
jgi:orotate phosphoribosyltransferase